MPKYLLLILFVNLIVLANVAQMFSDGKIKREDSLNGFTKINIWDASLVDMLTSIKEPKRYTIIDVRDRDSYDTGHIPGAFSVPWHELGNSTAEVLSGIKANQTVIIYCADSACASTFISAGRIADKLGLINIGIYGGGINEWRKCGLDLN
jgi:rhodanese-related sulfurtransferase